jgi:hypothetical protein
VKEINNKVDTRKAIRKVSLSDITAFEMWILMVRSVKKPSSGK